MINIAQFHDVKLGLLDFNNKIIKYYTDSHNRFANSQERRDVKPYWWGFVRFSNYRNRICLLRRDYLLVVHVAVRVVTSLISVTA